MKRLLSIIVIILLIFSNTYATSLPSEADVEPFSVTLSTIGPIVGTEFSYTNGIESYSGKAHAINNTSDPKTSILVSAWYETGTNKLSKIYTNEFTVFPNSEETFVGDGRQISSVDELNNMTLKVFAFADGVNLQPLSMPLVIKGIYVAPLHYEAEDATLTGNVAVRTDPRFSGGKCVFGFKGAGDSCTFHTSVPMDGKYDFTFVSASMSTKKVNYVKVDGLTVGELVTNTSSVETSALEQISLTAGNHDITIEPYWGWIYLAYLEITQSKEFDQSIFNVSSNLSNPNASEQAKSLMKYLTDIYGNYTLSGQQSSGGVQGPEVTAIHNATGKYPAVLGLDMMEYSPSRIAHYGKPDSIEKAIEFDQMGGIIAMCWHWNAPIKFLINTDEKTWYTGFRTESVNMDLNAILADENSADYQLLLSDIDAIAIQLKRLQEAGIPVLWRPLHEASGGWFWWGSAGSENYKKLWRIMYDRMTNYHGLNNLIWIYNGQSPDWYPGDAYVDIIGEDIYPGNRIYASQFNRFISAVKYTNPPKMVALSENGCLVDPDLAVLDHARWLWYATWEDSFVIDKLTKELSEEYTEKSMLVKVYNHESIITLDELPDWKNYKK